MPRNQRQLASSVREQRWHPQAAASGGSGCGVFGTALEEAPLPGCLLDHTTVAGGPCSVGLPPPGPGLGPGSPSRADHILPRQGLPPRGAERGGQPVPCWVVDHARRHLLALLLCLWHNLLLSLKKKKN